MNPGYDPLLIYDPLPSLFCSSKQAAEYKIRWREGSNLWPSQASLVSIGLKHRLETKSYHSLGTNKQYKQVLTHEHNIICWTPSIMHLWWILSMSRIIPCRHLNHSNQQQCTLFSTCLGFLLITWIHILRFQSCKWLRLQSIRIGIWPIEWWIVTPMWTKEWYISKMQLWSPLPEGSSRFQWENGWKWCIFLHIRNQLDWENQCGKKSERTSLNNEPSHTPWAKQVTLALIQGMTPPAVQKITKVYGLYQREFSQEASKANASVVRCVKTWISSSQESHLNHPKSPCFFFFRQRRGVRASRS